MNRATRLFWTLALAQVVFLLTWASYHEYVRQHAPVLLLKARPVDPRDLLRGDYMILSYDISEIPALTGVEQAASGSDVWVLLEQRDRYHGAVEASFVPLRPGPGQVLARGTLARRGWGGNARPVVDYGIEKYFVAEGKGTPRFQKMEVRVAVSPAHRLYVKQVLLDDRIFP